MAMSEVDYLNLGKEETVKVSAPPSSTLAGGNKTFTFADFTDIRSVYVTNKAALSAAAIKNDDGTLTKFDGNISITSVSGNQVTVNASSSYSGQPAYFLIAGI